MTLLENPKGIFHQFREMPRVLLKKLIKLQRKNGKLQRNQLLRR
jgi:hypothetical protein